MGRRSTLLVLIDLVQDLDVLLPVLLRLRTTPAVSVRTVVSRWLLRAAPRVPATLARLGLPFVSVRRGTIVDGRAPSLRGVDIVLAASESAASTHTAGHALARRARAAGLRTYALQHGLELGEHGRPPPSSGSATLFCWGPAGAEQAARTGAAPVVVGRAGPAPANPTFDLGVFENLHWDRYDQADRAAFLDRLCALARARPGLRMRVRAHPAGGWLDASQDRFQAFGAVRFETSAAARASPTSGPAAVASAARVITTPSTVALDGVMAGRPVALALDGGPAYAPLPLLRDARAWIDFADAAPESGPAEAAFLARHVAGGDAAASIVARLLSDLSGPKPSCEKRG